MSTEFSEAEVKAAGDADGMRAEVEGLRAALIATCNAIGAFAAPEVSTDFLMHVPEEARKKLERLTREREIFRECYKKEVLARRGDLRALDAARARAEAIARENEAMREVLRKVEFEGSWDRCPCCLSGPPSHCYDCALAAALAPAEGGEDGE